MRILSRYAAIAASVALIVLSPIQAVANQTFSSADPPPDSPTATTNNCANPLADTTGYNVIEGSAQDDQIWGTLGPDYILGGGGDDAIKGRDGNDYICAGPGRDGVHGGDGNDFVEGEEGRDFLVAANGDDTVFGGPDIDGIYGGAGIDTVSGGLSSNGVGGPPVDDQIADYVAGGGNVDAVTIGFDDETHQDKQPDSGCPAIGHKTDPDFLLPKLGTWSPKRLNVVNPKIPCTTVTGTVVDVRHPDESDGDKHLTVGYQPVVIEVSTVAEDPGSAEVDPYGPLAIARGSRLVVELMPRDYPYYHSLGINLNDNITVRGLYVTDDNPSHDSHTELHPVFRVSVNNGTPVFSGPRNAGSPPNMNPSGGRLIGTGGNEYHYCWDEGGTSCTAWTGPIVFQ